MAQSLTIDVDVDPAAWQRQTGMSLADWVAETLERDRYARHSGLTVTDVRAGE